MMNNGRVEELQKFVDDFREKIQLSSQIFELNSLKNNCDFPLKKKIRKSQSQIETGTEVEKIIRLPLLSKSSSKKSENNIFTQLPVWRPGKGVPDYFDRYKRLINKNEINNWEIVNKL